MVFHIHQLVLLLLALIAVPWMLLPKPFLLKKQHEEVHFSFLVDFFVLVTKAFGCVQMLLTLS